MTPRDHLSTAKHTDLIKKANARVVALRNGQTAPLSETEYLEMIKKSREEIKRIEQRIK